MFKTRLISDNGLYQSNQGAMIDVRLPWYRALPLSTVEIAEVRLDGEIVPRGEIKLLINGETIALDQLAGRDKNWWYVLDSAFLLAQGRFLHVGSEHEASVTIGLRPPYIPGFYRMTECTKRLMVRPYRQGTNDARS